MQYALMQQQYLSANDFVHPVRDANGIVLVMVWAQNVGPRERKKMKKNASGAFFAKEF